MTRSGHSRRGNLLKLLQGNRATRPINDDAPPRERQGAIRKMGLLRAMRTLSQKILDCQAEKLRRLYSFCRATAYTIAALAFSGGPR